MEFPAKTRQRLHAVATLARRIGDWIPLTWRGAFVLLFSTLALYHYGYRSLDLLLFVVGISGLVLTVLSALTVGLCSLLVRRSTRAQSAGLQRLEAGSPIPTGFSLPAFERIPLVRIHWRWLSPDGVECRPRLRDGQLLEEAVATRRCRVQEIHRQLEVFDAFGLAGVRWEHTVAEPWLARPYFDRLLLMRVLLSPAATDGLAHPWGAPDGDRMEIRRYVPGDSIRHILWKTYARTRQLNVRVPERSIHPDEKTVAYLLTGVDDEAAAAAARVALESGVLGPSWLFGADGTPSPVDSLDEALRAIAGSGSLPETPGGTRDDLLSFLRHPRIAGEKSCIVFAPARPGPWTETAIAASRHFGGSLSFVLATDGVSRTEPSPLWHRLLYLEEPSEGTPAAELQEASQTLQQAGFTTLLVDRRSGRAHGREMQRLPLGATG